MGGGGKVRFIEGMSRLVLDIFPPQGGVCFRGRMITVVTGIALFLNQGKLIYSVVQTYCKKNLKFIKVRT